jgi:hypothetical protein
VARGGDAAERLAGLVSRCVRPLGSGFCDFGGSLWGDIEKRLGQVDLEVDIEPPGAVQLERAFE